MLWWCPILLFIVLAFRRGLPAVYFQQGKQSVELRLLEPLAEDSQQLRAGCYLKKFRGQGRNQLILLTRQPYSLKSLPAVAQPLVQQLQVCTGIRINIFYSLSSRQTAAKLQLLPLLQQLPDTIVVQPDLLPFRRELIKKNAAEQMPVTRVQHDATTFNLFQYAALDHYG